MTSPFYMISNKELAACPEIKAGDPVDCSYCGETHPAKFAKKEDGTESDLLSYSCGKSSYLIGVSGRRVPQKDRVYATECPPTTDLAIPITTDWRMDAEFQSPRVVKCEVCGLRKVGPDPHIGCPGPAPSSDPIGGWPLADKVVDTPLADQPPPRPGRLNEDMLNKMRVLYHLLPDPGPVVARQLLDEIDRMTEERRELEARIEKLTAALTGHSGPEEARLFPTYEELREQNFAQARAYSEEVKLRAELEAELGRLRKQLVEALSGKRTMGCGYCGAALYEYPEDGPRDEHFEAALQAFEAHDRTCEHNPLAKEVERLRADIENLRIELHSARCLAKILAHSYEHDSRPPANVVAEAMRYDATK